MYLMAIDLNNTHSAGPCSASTEAGPIAAEQQLLAFVSNRLCPQVIEKLSKSQAVDGAQNLLIILHYFCCATQNSRLTKQPCP